MMFSEWTGLKMGMKNIRVWGLHKSDFKTILWEKFIRRRLTIDAFDLRVNNVDRYIQTIVNYDPVSILGYTSALVKLSKYIEDLEKKPTLRSLCSITVAGETLTESDRELIELTFDCGVFNLYGSREVTNIAQECEEHEGLHINTENVYLEIIKNEDHASPGEKGEIIVTDLNNLVMPFVRYSIGDIGVAGDGDCSCGRGFEILKRVEGRLTDFIRMPSGEIIPFLYFNYFFEQYGTFIKQFQVVQKNKMDQLLINISPTEKYDSSVGERIKEEMQDSLNNKVIIELNLVDEILPEKSGKIPVVKKF